VIWVAIREKKVVKEEKKIEGGEGRGFVPEKRSWGTAGGDSGVSSDKGIQGLGTIRKKFGSVLDGADFQKSSEKARLDAYRKMKRKEKWQKDASLEKRSPGSGRGPKNLETTGREECGGPP